MTFKAGDAVVYVAPVRVQEAGTFVVTSSNATFTTIRGSDGMMQSEPTAKLRLLAPGRTMTPIATPGGQHINPAVYLAATGVGLALSVALGAGIGYVFAGKKGAIIGGVASPTIALLLRSIRG